MDSSVTPAARPALQRESDLVSYAPALRRYFRRRAASTEVDDLTQEVFLNMHSRRSQVRIDNLQGYLFSVAAHVLSRHRTRRAFEGISWLTANDRRLDGPQAPSAEDEIASRERLQRLITTLEELPPRARSAFLLHRFEDMSYEAIARQMNISISAIEKHIMSALKVLRARLDAEI
jgi:RNA polymerase sigma factor (sigma-70 family)